MGTGTLVRAAPHKMPVPMCFVLNRYDYYYQEDFDKNGVVTGNNNTGGRDFTAAPKIGRGFFGTIYDWFSTVNSHLYNSSKDLKDLRLQREMYRCMAGSDLQVRPHHLAER